tara:strand:- start:268 stop:1008 length:741 start_codon:yes stop_codon:yes gene_type:complete
MRNDESSRIMMQAGTFYFQSAASGTAGNAISFTDVLRITNTGKIGIGQTDPQGDLHIGNISGSKNLIMHSTNNGTATIRFREGGSNSSGFNEYSIGMVGSRNAITINGQGAGEIIAIMGDTGKVGIDETNPDEKLHVNGAGLFESGVRGPVKYTGSYTANTNRDITGFGYGNYIVSIRSSGVYHWNGILVVTMYDTADFGVATLVNGSYATTITTSMVNLSAGNGTLRLVFNRSFGALAVRVMQIG